MLVLTLSPGEQLHIGDDVTLSFERKLDPTMQRYGISYYSKAIRVEVIAPEEIKILRNELLASPEDTP